MNFLGSSFRIGRLFGINIRVHVLFLIWVAFEMLDAGRAWRTQLLFLGLLFGIVLLHEFGHCLGARAVRGHAENILMWPLGGLAYAQAPMRPWPQFVTVASGPLVNVILCLLSAGVIYALAGLEARLPLNPIHGRIILPFDAPTWLHYVGIFYLANLFILGFNLLPIYPLDGGQLFHALLWPLLGLQRASIVACQVGLVGCALLAMLGLRGDGKMLLFIAIFGGLTCWQRLQAARHGWLVEESRFETYGPSGDPRPWWRRLLGIRSRPGRGLSAGQSLNPNPGGWAARQTQLQRDEAELDRILKKVSEQGIHSLTYVERQTLERITRQRQREEEHFQSHSRS